MSTALHERFKKYWPKHSDGITYSSKANFYFNDSFRIDDVTKKFVKGIGMNWEEFINQEVDSEIETMYFQIKPGFVWDGTKANADFDDKYPATQKLAAPSASWIASKINSELAITTTMEPILDEYGDPVLGEDGEITYEEITHYPEIMVNAEYGGATRRYIDEHELTWVATGSGISTGPFPAPKIREQLSTNPWYYFANTRHLGYVKDSTPSEEYDGGDYGVPEATYRATSRMLPTTAVSCSTSRYGVFALMNDDNSFELVRNENGTPKVFKEQMLTSGSNELYTRTQVVRYKYSYKYIFRGITVTSPIIKDMVKWYESAYQDLSEIAYNPASNDMYREDLSNSVADTIYKVIMSDMLLESNPTAGDNSLYKDGRLRIDVVANMKKRDFTRLMTSMIKIDYTVEDAKWWEIAIAVVLVIIVTVVSWGSATAAAVSVLGAMAQIAAFAGTMAIGLSIGSMVLSAVGGLSAGMIVRNIGKVVEVLGYVAAIAGVYAAIDQAVRQIAAKQAGVAVVDVTVDMMADVTLSDMINYAVDMAVESVKSSFTDVAQQSLGEVVNTVASAVDFAKDAYEYLVLNPEQQELEKELASWEEGEAQRSIDMFNAAYMDQGTIYMTQHARAADNDQITILDEHMENLNADVLDKSPYNV